MGGGGGIGGWKAEPPNMFSLTDFCNVYQKKWPTDSKVAPLIYTPVNPTIPYTVGVFKCVHNKDLLMWFSPVQIKLN